VSAPVREMSLRVQKLRNESLETAPELSIERAELLTEAYRQVEGTVSTPVLRALAFKHLMNKKTICINEGELIVGERGPAPQSTPTYPELCCHTIEDLQMINDRPKISFSVSDRVKELQREKIIPFWQGKSIRDQIFNLMSREWLECYYAGIFTEFMEQRAPGHTVAGDKIYKRGLLRIQQEIDQAMGKIDFSADPEAAAKKEQLQAMSICAGAVIDFALRHADKAREMAAAEHVPQRKEELELIAEICTRIPAHAPQNFWEALQCYWFIHLGVITELNTWDSFCPGRLDQHLYPFYEQGIEDGSLTREKARELLQCYWIKFNNQPAPPKVGVTLKESGTYTDFCNINIGGLTADGSDGVNELSYLLLEVIDEMRLLQPSTNIQVSAASPDLFIRCAAEVIRKGWGQPSVFNADAVVQELLNQGKSLVDARCGGTSGCVETGAFGKESYILTGYFNLPKVLEITLHRGVDPQTGNQLGPVTKDPRECLNFADLLEAFEQQLHYFIDIKITGNETIEKLYAEKMPAPFLSVIIDDCIERGKDYNAGGARYNTNYIQGVGIGSITDSLAAIKYHLYDRKRFDWDQLMAALQENYIHDEKMRNFFIHKTPRYGNDDDYADELMKEVFNRFYRAVNGRQTARGGTYRINMLPTTCHVYFGSVLGAMPDGRKAGLPLSEGISPVQGADHFGPTAVIKSAAKMDHLITGGTLLNQKFTPQLLSGEKGLNSLVHLIRSYFRLNGHHIQFNVIDKSTLLDAQLNPEQYSNLIVRVAGYSDYFNNLSEALQNEIIDRTEHASF